NNTPSGDPPMTTPHLLAIDQGTTSTRAVVYDAAGRACGSASRELTQHYPRPGWVEHDAEEIWNSVAEVVPRALAEAGIEGRQLTALGRTNKRGPAVRWSATPARPAPAPGAGRDRGPADSGQVHKPEDSGLRSRT